MIDTIILAEKGSYLWSILTKKAQCQQ